MQLYPTPRTPPPEWCGNDTSNPLRCHTHSASPRFLTIVGLVSTDQFGFRQHIAKAEAADESTSRSIPTPLIIINLHQQPIPPHSMASLSDLPAPVAQHILGSVPLRWRLGSCAMVCHACSRNPETMTASTASRSCLAAGCADWSSLVAPCSRQFCRHQQPHSQSWCWTPWRLLHVPSPCLLISRGPWTKPVLRDSALQS